MKTTMYNWNDKKVEEKEMQDFINAMKVDNRLLGLTKDPNKKAKGNKNNENR